MFESTDEVFADGQVYGGLASDRGIDHGGERCRNVYDWDTAQPSCGDEAHEVGCYSSAHGNDAVGALGTLFGEPLVDLGRGSDGLGFFTEFEDERVGFVSAAFQGFMGASHEQREHCVVGDEKRPTVDASLAHLRANAFDSAARDYDAVVALRGFDGCGRFFSTRVVVKHRS